MNHIAPPPPKKKPQGSDTTQPSLHTSSISLILFGAAKPTGQQVYGAWTSCPVTQWSLLTAFGTKPLPVTAYITTAVPSLSNCNASNLGLDYRLIRMRFSMSTRALGPALLIVSNRCQSLFSPEVSGRGLVRIEHGIKLPHSHPSSAKIVHLHLHFTIRHHVVMHYQRQQIYLFTTFCLDTLHSSEMALTL